MRCSGVISTRTSVQAAGAIQPWDLQLLPGCAITYGADQAEHVALLAVFADQGGSEPEPAHGLDASGGPEHRGGQQMHLVVDHQSPLGPVEQCQVRVALEQVGVLPRLGVGPGEHLIGGDRDRLDVFAIARVLAHHRRVDVGLVAQLPHPLPGGRDRRGDDEGVRSAVHDRRQPDDRLAGSTRKHQRPVSSGRRPARPPRLHRLGLVSAQGGGQVEAERLALCVAGLVGGGPADAEQRLLECAPIAETYGETVAVEAIAHQLRNHPVAHHLFEDGRVGGGERQSAAVEVTHDHQPAVATHLVVDLGEHRRRHRVLGEPGQRRRHLARAQPGRSRIPQAERGDPVGVDVLG